MCLWTDKVFFDRKASGNLTIPKEFIQEKKRKQMVPIPLFSFWGKNSGTTLPSRLISRPVSLRVGFEPGTVADG